MITTVTGENSSARDATIRTLVNAFIAEHGDLAIQRLDGEEHDTAAILSALQTMPFLSARQLVVVRSPSAQKSFVEQAEAILADIPETTDLIIIEPKLDKRQAYYKALKNVTDFRDHPLLDERGTARWLVEYTKGAISQTDALYLIGRVGLDQQLLGNEIEKLLLYEPRITKQSIDLLTEASPQSTIFELVEAAFTAQTKRALELYEEQRALKVEPPQIVAMLTWQLHILALLICAGDRSLDAVAKDARLSPYVVKKSARLASRLTRSRLTTLVARLSTIDRLSKRAPIDTDQALKTYIIELAH